MRTLICGGRHFEEWAMLSKALREIKPSVVIQGGASGADRLAVKWAEINEVPVVTYPANWRIGKRGGPERNAFMLRDSRPDLVVALPGGKGTANMVQQAREAGVEVMEIRRR